MRNRGFDDDKGGFLHLMLRNTGPSSRGANADKQEAKMRRLENTAFNQPITTKLSESDLRALIAADEKQGTNKTALIRLAIRQDLYQSSEPPAA